MNVEYNVFKIFDRQAALDHHEEANKNQFYEFAHDSASLLNKDKHQAFRIKFADANFRYNDVIASSFRKTLSHKAGKVAELAEEACTKCFDL